ncbi:MAG TPA: DegT/DnrJ/EryC1/StrS family aminotransferase, partial [Bacillales bacterium]|nr:DegT/DnrJ/EryC1/StrS family aminotransferase [Bacillales bacterium]
DPYKLEDYLKDIAEIKGEECFNTKTNRRIKAVVPMHTFGHPVDLDPLMEVCQKYKLELVEDAAESLGSYYKGKHTGTFGKASSLSFNGNKIMTTGGGGAILTDDDHLADLAKHLTTTAKKPHLWEYMHDEIGYNFRMPNINAALGCAQLEKVPDFLRRKRVVAKRYIKAFENVSGVEIKEEQPFSKSNYWLNTLILDKKHASCRDDLLKGLNDAGIMARPIWMPMHRLPMYRDFPKMDVSISEQLVTRVINLPSSARIGGQYE